MSRFRAGATPQARVQSLADRAAALPRWPWARGHNVSLSARVVDDETLVGIHHKIMLHARDAKIAQELVECGARNARCPRGKTIYPRMSRYRRATMRFALLRIARVAGFA